MKFSRYTQVKNGIWNQNNTQIRVEICNQIWDRMITPVNNQIADQVKEQILNEVFWSMKYYEIYKKYSS